jgi:protein-tyrosine phosphatase
MKRVLFVCTGNICRSPTALGVFRKLVAEAGLDDRIAADAAGTHDYHAGEPPDARAQSHAERRGYDLSRLRARRLRHEDFRDFDLIVAMDREHRAILARLAPASAAHKVRLLLEFAPGAGGDEVPDPYYGGPAAFEHVLDLVEDAAAGLLDHVRAGLDR